MGNRGFFAGADVVHLAAGPDGGRRGETGPLVEVAETPARRWQHPIGAALLQSPTRTCAERSDGRVNG